MPSKDTVAYSIISEYTKHFFKNKKTNFWTLQLIMNVIFDVLPTFDIRHSTILSFNIFSCMTVLVFGAPCFRARHIPHHPRNNIYYFIILLSDICTCNLLK